MRVKNVQVKTPSKTNPQPIKSRMENFLSAPSQDSQLRETKPAPPSQAQPSEEKRFEEIIKEIEEIEGKLNVRRNLDLSTFNQIAYNKKLMFKLLFIKQRIYVVVKDATARSTIVAINPPRWGGSSLRYLVTACAEDWCNVVMKTTSKGNIYSYVSISANNVEDDDINDIFD